MQMQTKNPKYKNQGIHVIVSLLTVVDGHFKVLLVKRKNKPYQDHWSLIGGAVYNNETLETALGRELYEKSGIKDVVPMQYKIFSDPNRAKETGFRMLGIAYVGLIDASAITFIKETAKTSDIDWFDISEVPTLAYDHNEVLLSAIDYLKNKIFEPCILKTLFPDTVSIPELQTVFEAVLGENLDRRNFRKKLILDGIVQDTGLEKTTPGKKPSKLYRIIEK